MDTSHTSSTCPVRIADQQWRNSEVSLGARSLLVRAVDGSAPVEWLPYDDIANVAEVDDPATSERFIELTARDGRCLSMQLDPPMLTSLLAALSGSAAHPEEISPRPTELGIGAAAATATVFSTAPPVEPSTTPPAPTAPEPSIRPRDGATEPTDAGSRRLWALIGGLLLLVALVAMGLFLLVGGDDAESDRTSSAPTTDGFDIDAATEPDAGAQTTTTVVTDPGDDGPASALTVGVRDVIADASSDSPAIYLAFTTTNETTRDVSAYVVEVTLTATDGQGQEISWTAPFRCAAALDSKATRSGSFADQPPGADLDALVDCRVGAWPISFDDPAQSAFTEAIASGTAWSAEVVVVEVRFSDGTVLD